MMEKRAIADAALAAAVMADAESMANMLVRG
jgi:hypothetical protein